MYINITWKKIAAWLFLIALVLAVLGVMYMTMPTVLIVLGFFVGLIAICGLMFFTILGTLAGIEWAVKTIRS